MAKPEGLRLRFRRPLLTDGEPLSMALEGSLQAEPHSPLFSWHCLPRRVLRREKAKASKTTSGKVPATAFQVLSKFRESSDDEMVTVLLIE
jgi:hypothetical protein